MTIHHKIQFLMLQSKKNDLVRTTHKCFNQTKESLQEMTKQQLEQWIEYFQKKIIKKNKLSRKPTNDNDIFFIK